MAIEKLLEKTNGWMLWTTLFLSGQPLIKTWVAHGQPYPIWISESLLGQVTFIVLMRSSKLLLI
jgi:hypothetical protein